MLYICNIFLTEKDVMNELMYLIRNIMIAAVCEDGCYLLIMSIVSTTIIDIATMKVDLFS